VNVVKKKSAQFQKKILKNKSIFFEKLIFSKKITNFAAKSTVHLTRISMSKLRILYVTSEINPFLSMTAASDYVRRLPELMQEDGMEIRILMPKFGIINERKNRLHEVVRLSGINISVADEERPLLIKVASIPQAKLQVYFIDNDELFQRKEVFCDKNEKAFTDNDERAIFFSKGVIETIRKLGWAPDIVHCNDWMSGLIPFYLRTTYKNDPVFKNTKTAFTLFEDSLLQNFKTEGLFDKVHNDDITEDDFQIMSKGTTDCFIKAGVSHSDIVIMSSDKAEERFADMLSEIPLHNKRVERVTYDELSRDYFSEMYLDAVGELKTA
jgi:starch synthase